MIFYYTIAEYYTIHRSYALSSHHQRGFVQQQMGTETETHSQTLYGERLFIGGLHQIFSPKNSGYNAERL